MTFTYYTKEIRDGSLIPVMVQHRASGCPIPDCYLNGRPVYLGDAELRGVDSYFLDACFADTMEDLDDDELDQLTEEQQDRLITMNIEKYGWFRK